MKLSIIIPAFNEEQTIEDVVRRVQEVNLGAIEKEIIVVDDASSDSTGDILKGISDISHIRHARNQGKGGALRTGFQCATGNIVLIQDADLEYDPNDYLAVIQPIMQGCCDVVIGSRFLNRKLVFWGHNRAPYLSHYIGNRLIIMTTNLLYARNFTDYEGCYKAFSRESLRLVDLRAQGFEFDNELICKLMRKGVRIVEVPIDYSPRSYKDGKKIKWRHGLVILWTIVKWRVLPV